MPDPAVTAQANGIAGGGTSPDDLADLSYREFPLRLDDTDDDADESEADGHDDGWEPRHRPPIESITNPSDDLIVHVMINDHKEAVLNVRHGAVVSVAVDEFAAEHNLPAAKRQMLTDHILNQLPIVGDVIEPIAVAITVMASDRFVDRCEIRERDDLIARLQEFADRNRLSASQRRRLMASALVNMERIELGQDRDRSPTAFVVRLDGAGGHELDDVLCDDDLLCMMNADRVLAFCDRRRISRESDHRQALIQAISSCCQQSAPIIPIKADPSAADQYAGAPAAGPCLVLRLPEDRSFQLYNGDDVLDRIDTFADQHRLNDDRRLDLVRDVLGALIRAAAPAIDQQLTRTEAVSRFADRHRLSVDRHGRSRLLIEVDRAVVDRPSSLSNKNSSNHHHRSRASSSSQVFHRLYAEHLIRKRKSLSNDTRHQRRTSSSGRSVVCDRLYNEGLKFLHRRQASAATADLDDSELTFRPQIQAEIRRRSHSRQFSLGRTSSRTQKRQLQYLIERNEQEMSACTFQPEVRSDFHPEPGPVHERLYRDGQARSQRQIAMQVVAEQMRLEQDDLKSTATSIGRADPDRIDRLHNHNLYKQQAIESFRKQFHEFDADGNRLFHIRDYITKSSPRMEANQVAEYLHRTSTCSSSGSAATAFDAKSPPNPIESRSNALVHKAIRSRLRRLYSSLMHDGVIDGLSALRLKSNQNPVPIHLRDLIESVVIEGTNQGRTLNFEQFSKRVLLGCHSRGILPSSLIQDTSTKITGDESSPKTPTRSARRPGRDVFTELYNGARVLKDRRFVMQYKAMALESARDGSRAESLLDRPKSGSQTAR